VLAGFRPNVAEEMTGDEFQNGSPKANPPQTPTTDNKPQDQPSAQDAFNAKMNAKPEGGDRSYIDQLRDALNGDTELLAELTKFYSKRDSKEIPGCRDFAKLSETRAKIAFETWKRQTEPPHREPGQDD
jgi:hypothetical protein